MQIAIPNKGALSEDAVLLLKEAGYKCARYGRELVVTDRDNEIDFVFLRPRDIAIYVGNGVVDLGITGRDLTMDSGAKVDELLALNFGKSKFCYAVPERSGITIENMNNVRIATSYPAIVQADLKKRNLNCEIVRLDGAVEISVKLGVADMIADVVESGRTLIEAGLKVIGEPIMASEALLISRNAKITEQPEVKKLLARVKGILVARAYAMIEYDVPRIKLDEACRITPGLEAPTIAPLSNDSWVAVKAMIVKKERNEIMDALYAVGARGIVVVDIQSCRL